MSHVLDLLMQNRVTQGDYYLASILNNYKKTSTWITLEVGEKKKKGEKKDI